MMGQAKNRGTFEQRVTQARERQEQERKAFAERVEAERKRQIAARLDGPAVVVRGSQRLNKSILLAALAAAGVAGIK